MKMFLPTSFSRLAALVHVALVALAASPSLLRAQASPAAPVTVTDNGKSWTLDNGIVKATITKDSGSMPSLIYKGVQILQASGGTWEHNPQGAPVLVNSLSIDPATNGGARAEVSIKGKSNGTFTMTRSAPGGGTQVDIEIRYSLGRGDSGIYVYSILSHPASYPAMGVGAEDRYITRLNQAFDWITVDKDRNMLEAAPTDWGTGVVVHAKEQRIMSKGVYKNSVEHKYSYSGMQYVTKAYGWSSTKYHIGAWFINPTIEYLSGGPTRIDLDAHFGDNGDPEPIILDYWHSGHYDGARAQIPAGEDWSKVVGPIYVYVNSLDSPAPTTQAELDTLKATEGNPTVPASWTANANALWQNALDQYKKENAAWPYDWVKGVDYTPLAQRGNVKGQIVLDDPLAPKGSSKKLPHLVIGLTHADIDPASIPRPTFGGFAPGSTPGTAPGATSTTPPAPGLRPAPAPDAAAGPAARNSRRTPLRRTQRIRLHPQPRRRQLDSRRPLLPVLQRRNPRRQIQHHQGPPRHLHPPRHRRRRPRRLCPGQHHRRTRQDPRPRQARLEARPLRQAGLGDRLPRPRRRRIPQRRQPELLALGLGPPLRAALPQRPHLHHRQERPA